MLDSASVTDLDRVRDHTEDIIQQAATADSPILVEAPPNSGKTTTAVELPTVIDTPVTYLAARTDLYEQAKEIGEELDGVRWEVIPSPHRTCPTFRGENDGDEARAKQLYERGYSGPRIHFLEAVDTPCQSEATTCEYLETHTQLREESEEIDLLIGNHKSSYQTPLISDRIVILDEFQPETFLTRFPDTDRAQAADTPGDIISHFLTNVDDHDDDFPTDTYSDLTDVLVHRDEWSACAKAVNWFEENGVTKTDAEQFDFLEVDTYEHQPGHLAAPFLTFSLLCMEQIAPGFELAPAPDDDLIQTVWGDIVSNPHTRCLRDRNTGEMAVLQPPDFTAAAQVIGLDGLPTKELWDCVFGTGDPFHHRQVIDREADFTRYLSGALNLTSIQIGEGMNHYHGGRFSNKDQRRFAAVQAHAGDRFALISTTSALENYTELDVLEDYVKASPDCPGPSTSDGDGQLCVLNYGRVRSSNAFADHRVGVVSGTPHPGDDVICEWAALSGSPAFPSGEGEDRSYEDAHHVFRHFVHHQVVQAILRFGRDESVWKTGGASVYVNTKALPEWFTPDAEFKVESRSKAQLVIEQLIAAAHPDSDYFADMTVRNLYEALDGNVGKSTIRRTVKKLDEHDLVTTRPNAGPYGATYYCWDGDDQLQRFPDDPTQGILLLGNQLNLLDNI